MVQENHPRWDPVVIHALLIPTCFENEPVPTSSITALAERIATLETKSQVISESVTALRGDFNHLREELTQGLSAERTVTWKPLLWLLGSMVTITLGVAGFFYYELLPDKIENGISTSKSLTKNFEQINDRLKNVDKNLEGLSSDIKSLADPRFMSLGVKDAVSGEQATLKRRLPDARRLLSQIKRLRIVLPAKDYKDISKPLMAHYSSAKPPLKQDVWYTLQDLASTRTVSDSAAQPLTETEIAEAKRAGGYYENQDVDLSLGTAWTDAVFKNCRILLTKPNNNLTLTNVRFIDCDFSSLSENESSRKLLQFVVEAGTPRVTATVVRYAALPPVYKTEGMAK